MVMKKTGDIYSFDRKGHRVAYWRPVDGGREVFLGAVDLKAFRTHPFIRKMFFELALAAMANRDQPTDWPVAVGMLPPEQPVPAH
jgi:hypothetical protein